MTEAKKSNFIIDLLTVAGVSLMACMSVMLNPIMQLLIERYPDVPVATVRSLSSLGHLVSIGISVPLTLFFAKKIKYKPCMILSSIFAMGGMLPYFFKDPTFTIVFISRILVGVGFGLCILRNAVIRDTFAGDDKKIANWIGFSAAMIGILNSILQPVVGSIADVDLRKSFIIYGVCIIPLLINIFVLKEPVKSGETEEFSVKGMAKSKNMGMVYFLTAIVTIATVCSYPLLSGVSTLIAEKGLGAAAAAGSVTGAYTLGNTIGAFIFGWHSRKMKRYGMAIDLACLTVAFALLVIAPNLFALIAAAFLGGVGHTLLRLFGLKIAGDITDGSAKIFGATLVTTAISIGSYLSTFWFPICNNIAKSVTFLSLDVERTYFVGAVVFLIMTVIMIVVNPWGKDDKAL